ncbi:hypothetical protein PV08_04217 [Exophiala spinifera]|uniref:Uncharacterized protein n=1 Tax=Exophiala spinifera TaxID=91928 RepID=A0A0D1YPE2_9EURO|nr:uncharacterized protein PV08_04217 [Exophiala spinifera]KIW17026.1 hypothetical protein PV08_04217 [Exophiala spinifera]
MYAGVEQGLIYPASLQQFKGEVGDVRRDSKSFKFQGIGVSRCLTYEPPKGFVQPDLGLGNLPNSNHA